MVKLTEKQQAFRSECVAFANEHINHNINTRDKAGHFDKDLWKLCRSINLHGIFISKRNGGLESSLQNGMSFLESLGFACRDNGLSFAIVAQQLSCTMTLDKFATTEEKVDLIKDIVNGEKIIAHAITESSSGSNAFDMKSQYEWQDDTSQFLITGEKTYCSNLPVADYALSYINSGNKTEESKICSAFLIPTSMLSGVEVIEKMGLNTCIMGRANFNVKIGKDQMINEEGQGRTMFQEAIMYERIGMGALHLGTIERLLNECIMWVKNRKSGTSTLSQHQSITHPLVVLHNEWIVLRSYLYGVTNENLSFSKLYFHASILKDKISALYVEACQIILQTYGGLGYTKQIEVERMLRDAIASKIYSGTSKIQKEIVWKYIS